MTCLLKHRPLSISETSSQNLLSVVQPCTIVWQVGPDGQTTMLMRRYMASEAKVIVVVLPSEADVASNFALGVSMHAACGSSASCTALTRMPSDGIMRSLPAGMILKVCARLASSQSLTGALFQLQRHCDLSWLCRHLAAAGASTISGRRPAQRCRPLISAEAWLWCATFISPTCNMTQHLLATVQ